MTDELTPFEPASPEVIAWVDDRCDRIARAKGERGAQAAYIHAMKALPRHGAPRIPTWQQYEMVLLALEHAAWAAGVPESVATRWHGDTRARVAREIKEGAARWRQRQDAQ